MGYRRSEVRILSPRLSTLEIQIETRDSARAGSTEESATMETTGNPVRVVIAGDESIIRMDLREMLTNLGYHVVGEASDGRTALDLTHRLRPDLVILDIKMPGMDGIEAAEHISEERLAPVVLL